MLLAESEPLGAEGLFWLHVYTANSYGFDKDTLKARVDFVIERLPEWLSYAEDPLKNKGWFKADKPWVFLACCFELKLINDWVEAGGQVKDFPSNLPVFADGSCNGLQHLTALSKDEEMAPYVNLVKTERPGDIYSFIGEAVWENLKEAEAGLSPEIVQRFEEVLNTSVVLQGNYDKAPGKSDKKARAYEELQTWRNNSRFLREQLFPVYWNRITDKKLRRKIVKR